MSHLSDQFFSRSTTLNLEREVATITKLYEARRFEYAVIAICRLMPAHSGHDALVAITEKTLDALEEKSKDLYQQSCQALYYASAERSSMHIMLEKHADAFMRKLTVSPNLSRQPNPRR